MKNISDADIEGKRVLMRVDFNVPMDKEGRILDDTKMRAALPSIEYVLSHKGKLILMSHLGRPKGKPVEEFSLKGVASHLETLLDAPVSMAEDCIGEKVGEKAKALRPGEVLVLENLRFHPGEEENNPEFARQLAALGDVYINDAFGTAHRAHASTAGVADYLPGFAGFLMEREVNMLNKVLDSPQNPRMAILGGAKVADKLGLIDNFLDKMDVILIGGGMANTFLQAQGKNIGKSLFEKDLVPEALRLIDKAHQKNVRLLLPVDVIITSEISADADATTVSTDKVPADMMIVDIGPRTIAMYIEEIEQAKTIIWNGPMGVYEYEQFARGSKAVTEAMAGSSAVGVIGGGDTAVLAHDLGLEDKITHISTGGGATLEFLEGIKLPGVVACGA